MFQSIRHRTGIDPRPAPAGDWHGHCKMFIEHLRERDMLGWALIFFIIAIIAAVFGFGGIAGAASGIAQILFFLFLVLLAISLVMHLVRGRRSGPPL
jgi:uncharacterized membrane protein YtjA (UPF0391 family)